MSHRMTLKRPVLRRVCITPAVQQLHLAPFYEDDMLPYLLDFSINLLHIVNSSKNSLIMQNCTEFNGV
jgi:hypothetical protein